MSEIAKQPVSHIRDLIAVKITRFLGYNSSFSLEQWYAAAKVEE